MIRLYTTFYPEKDAAREKELQLSLGNNLGLAEIGQVYILNEGSYLPSAINTKTVIIPIAERPTYSHFFSLINSVTGAADINIIANTDIYFDGQLSVLYDYDFKNTCIALTRWNVQPDGSSRLFNRHDSQDVWIFKGKVKNINGDFPLGIPYCDNRILFELQQAGYRVINPAFSIKAFHLHAGERAAYDKRKLKQYVAEPYRYLTPHNLYSLPRTICYNFTHKQKLTAYRYDIKKINRWLLVKLLRKTLKIVFRKNLPLIGAS